MFPSRRSRHATAWIAALAILLASFAPAWAHAVAAGKARAGLQQAWTEICTAAGVPQSAPHGLPHFDHCPFCALGQPGVTPAAVVAAIPASATGRVHPPLFYGVPRTLHAWPRARPRAPPFPA